SVTDSLLALPAGTRFAVTFPLTLTPVVSDAVVIENLRAQGFLRVVVDGEVLDLEQVADRGRALPRDEDLLVVVDRLSASPQAAGRIAEAVATAFREGDGDCVVHLPASAPAALDRGSPQGASNGTRARQVVSGSSWLRFT